MSHEQPSNERLRFWFLSVASLLGLGVWVTTGRENGPEWQRRGSQL